MDKYMRYKWNADLLSLVFFITATVAEVSASAEMTDELPARRCQMSYLHGDDG